MASDRGRSGDGWVRTPDGAVHWGRYGAAGLLLRCPDPGGQEWFLLAQRAGWVHGGRGQWAIPGGAIDEREAPIDAALREFDEEIGRLPGGFRVRGLHGHVPAPGQWSYRTVCADVDERPHYDRSLSLEHDAARWFTRAELSDPGLRPGCVLFGPFAAALPALLAIFARSAPGQTSPRDAVRMRRPGDCGT